MAELADVYALIQQSRTTGHSVAPAEQAVRLADHLGDERTQAEARLQLLNAYDSSNAGTLLFTPLQWLLQRYRESPPWLDDRLARRLLALFRASVYLIYYPEVPLNRIEESLELMRQCYGQAGEGSKPVLKAEFLLADHVRGVAGAEREFEAWLRAERTGLAGCALCDSATITSVRTLRGDWEGALELALAEIAGGGTCAVQPSGLYALVLEPLLMAGRVDEAARAHRRGWPMIKRNHVGYAALHLRTLARADAIDRGLDGLDQWIGVLAEGIRPFDRMIFSAAAARLLDAAAGTSDLARRTIRHQDHDVRVADLRDQLRDQALDLAQRFDARNGTTTISRHVQDSWLQAPDLPRLPFPKPPPPPKEAADRHPLAPSLAGLAAASPERLADLLDLAQRYAPAGDLEVIADEWRRRRDQLPVLREQAGAARLAALAALEYALAWSQPDITAAQAEPYVRSAAGLYRAAGREAEAVLAEQWLAARDGRTGDACSMIAAVDRCGNDEQRLRARLRVLTTGLRLDSDLAARLLMEVGAMPCAVDSPPGFRRSWAVTRGLGSDSAERLYERTGAGLSILLPGEYPAVAAHLHQRKALACQLLGRDDELRSELSAAEQAGLAAGDTARAAVLLFQAQVAQAQDQAELAEKLFTRAAAVAERGRNLAVVVDANGRLAELVRSAGRLLEAAEFAERGLAAIEAARASGGFLDPSLGPAQARITELTAQLCADLEETTRAAGLYERAAGQWADLDAPGAAGQCWSSLARLVARTDALAAVRAGRFALDCFERAGDQASVMAARRDLPEWVQRTDGLDAALVELDAAVALTDTNDLRALADPDFRSSLGDWDFEYERLDLRQRRARLHHTAGQAGKALEVLGDVPERLDALGARSAALEAQVLRARLLFSAGEVDHGIAQLGQVLGALRTVPERQATVPMLAALGFRALSDAGREEEARAFWAAHVG